MLFVSNNQKSEYTLSVYNLSLERFSCSAQIQVLSEELLSQIFFDQSHQIFFMLSHFFSGIINVSKSKQVSGLPGN